MSAMMRNVYCMRTQTYGAGNAIATKRWVMKAIAQKQHAENAFHSRNKERY